MKLLMVILHWVDDLIMASPSKKTMQAQKTAILTKFKGRDLGPAEEYLNLKIERNRVKRTLKISQPRHVETVLETYGMATCAPKLVPISTGADLTTGKESDVYLDPKTPYLACVGALLYIATCTRPDLLTAVSMLARHMSKPTERHWVVLKGVLRYLAGTKTLGIQYGPGDFMLKGWSDADYATCKDTRRSRSGYVFTVGGGAVSWSSKLQTVVATSSAESEYIG